MAGIVLESIAACRRATYCLRFLRVSQSPYVICPPLAALKHQTRRHIGSDGPGDKNGKDQLHPMKPIQLGQGQLAKDSGGSEVRATPPDRKDKPAEKRTELPFEVRPEIPMEVQPNHIQPKPLEIKPPNPHPIICTSDFETFGYEDRKDVDPSIESEAKSYDSSESLPPPVVNLMDDQTPSSTTTEVDKSTDSPFIFTECDWRSPSTTANENVNSRDQVPSAVTSKSPSSNDPKTEVTPSPETIKSDLESKDLSSTKSEPNGPNPEPQTALTSQDSPSKRKRIAPGSIASLDLKVKPQERKANLQSSPRTDNSQRSSRTETEAVDSGSSPGSSYDFPVESREVHPTNYSSANDRYDNKFGQIVGKDQEQKRPSTADTTKENVVDSEVIDQWVDKFKRLYMAENAAFGLNHELNDEKARNRLQNMVMKDNKWVYGNKDNAEPSSSSTAKGSANDKNNVAPMGTAVIKDDESAIKKTDTISTTERSSAQNKKDTNHLQKMVKKDNKDSVEPSSFKTDKSSPNDKQNEKPKGTIVHKDNDSVSKSKDTVEAISSTIHNSSPEGTLPLNIEAKLKPPNDKKDKKIKDKVMKEKKSDFKDKDTVEKVSTPSDPDLYLRGRSSHEGDYPLDIDEKPRALSNNKDEKTVVTKTNQSSTDNKITAKKVSTSNPVISKTDPFTPGDTLPVNVQAKHQDRKDKMDEKPMIPMDEKTNVTALENKDSAGPISTSPKGTLDGNPDAPTEFKESKKDLRDSDKDKDFVTKNNKSSTENKNIAGKESTSSNPVISKTDPFTPGDTLPVNVQAKHQDRKDKMDEKPMIPMDEKTNVTASENKDSARPITTSPKGTLDDSKDAPTKLTESKKDLPDSDKNKDAVKKNNQSSTENKNTARKESTSSNPGVSKNDHYRPGDALPVNVQTKHQDRKDKMDEKPMIPMEEKTNVKALENKDSAGPISASPNETLDGSKDAPTKLKELKKDLPDSDKDKDVMKKNNKPSTENKNIAGKESTASNPVKSKTDNVRPGDNKQDRKDKTDEKPMIPMEEKTNVTAPENKDSAGPIPKSPKGTLDGSKDAPTKLKESKKDLPDSDKNKDAVTKNNQSNTENKNTARKESTSSNPVVSQTDIYRPADAMPVNVQAKHQAPEDKMDEKPMIPMEKKTNVTALENKDSAEPISPTPKETLDGSNDAPTKFKESKKDSDKDTISGSPTKNSQTSTEGISSLSDSKVDDDKELQLTTYLLDKDQEKSSSKSTEEVVSMFEKDHNDFLKGAEDGETLDAKTVPEYIKDSQTDVLGMSASGSLNTEDAAPDNKEKLDEIRADKEDNDSFSDILEDANAEQKDSFISSSVDMENSTLESTNFNLAEKTSSFIKASKDSDSETLDQENLSSTDEDTEPKDTSQTETTSLLPNDSYDSKSDDASTSVPMESAEPEESEHLNPDRETSELKDNEEESTEAREESETQETEEKVEKEKPQLEEGELAMKLLDNEAAEMRPPRAMPPPPTEKPTKRRSLAEKIPALGGDSRTPGEKGFIQKLFEKILGRGNNEGKRKMSTYTAQRHLSTGCTIAIPPSYLPSKAQDFRQGSPVQALVMKGLNSELYVENQELQPSPEAPAKMILQQADVMPPVQELFAKKSEDLTEIKGGSTTCKCPKKSPREIMQEKQNAQKIIILGGSEECAKKMKHLKELIKKSDDERDHFSSISQFFSQLRLSIFPGAPKSSTK
ncbi:hypothetical protein KR038_001443 [Drosophila bunnanda]|nr:hypothetical protein KR038_001443 [Drosophila bunnanda]